MSSPSPGIHPLFRLLHRALPHKHIVVLPVPVVDDLPVPLPDFTLRSVDVFAKSGKHSVQLPGPVPFLVLRYHLNHCVDVRNHDLVLPGADNCERLGVGPFIQRKAVVQHPAKVAPFVPFSKRQVLDPREIAPEDVPEWVLPCERSDEDGEADFPSFDVVSDKVKGAVRNKNGQESYDSREKHFAPVSMVLETVSNYEDKTHCTRTLVGMQRKRSRMILALILFIGMCSRQSSGLCRPLNVPDLE